MEANNILTADVLDIIFDDRNKAYGAYDLRKNYDRRLSKAVLAMLLLVVLLLLTYMLVASMKPAAKPIVEVTDYVLDKVDNKKIEPPIVVPPKVIEPPKIKMVILTAPLIVKTEVNPEDMPPPLDEIENAKIGLVKSEGDDEKGIVTPPVDPNKGVVEIPKKQDDAEVIFTRVEIESQYPGGLSAWATFVGRNLIYPQEAVDEGKQGTVMVKFVVDTEGNVSDVNVVSGPEELRTAAMKVIKKSGKWEPAIQNGKKVKSYKSQPITFRLSE